MRVNVREAMDALFSGKDCRKSHSVYAEQSGESGFHTVYSYGRHFPLVVLTGSVALVNPEKYSVTTSVQQGSVAQYLTLADYRNTGTRHTLNGREYQVWASNDPAMPYDRIPALVKRGLPNR